MKFFFWISLKRKYMYTSREIVKRYSKTVRDTPAWQISVEYSLFINNDQNTIDI